MRTAATRNGTALTVLAVMVAAFVARLLLGLRTQLDADEATQAVAAYQILHGHPLLMEADAHYLGALESYILAPFVAVFGTTLLAVRLSMAAVGAVLALCAYWLGRELFHEHRRALLLAAL